MTRRRASREDEFRKVEEPSTLFVLWPESDPPLEEEVRLAIQSRHQGTEWIDELESGGEVLWGTVARVPEIDSDVLIWAEERGDLSDGLIEDGLWDAEEREAAIRCRWLIGIETYLDPIEPQRTFQEQLRLLADVAVPGLAAVYDDNALVVRSGRHVIDLAAAATPPRISTLYAIHSVGGRGGTWLHTHGLARAGLPEIDLMALPGDFLREGYDLIDAAVDSLMGGLRPAAQDGRLVLGEGLAVRALWLEDAMELFPPEFAGGSLDREGDMADHGGRHLVLLDRRRAEPPLAALTRLASHGVTYKSRDESERQSALSRERWGTFGQLFAIHRRDAWRFHVKLAYERGSAPDAREHLWFEVLELKPGQVRARLINDPVDVPSLKRGDASWQPLDRLTDWLIVTPSGTYDPEVAPLLLAE